MILCTHIIVSIHDGDVSPKKKKELPSSKSRQNFNRQQDVRIPEDLVLQHCCCEDTKPLTDIRPDTFVATCNTFAFIRSVASVEDLVHKKQDVRHKLRLRPVFLFL
jgi:hypothetical protein